MPSSSAPLLPVLVDCDGVLATFNDHLLSLIESDRRHAHVTNYNIFNLIEGWHGTKVKQRALALCGRPDFWEAQPVMDGAFAAIETIRKSGFPIRCVTSPWYSCRTWDYTRREWLKRHFDIDRDHVIVTGDKSIIGGALFIDDRPEHITGWTIHNAGAAILYDAPYNTNHEGPRIDWGSRIHQLSDLLETARDYLRRRP